MKHSNKKTQKGFTLIELMIVVAVIGVLSAIALPQYQKYVAKSEVASVLATLTGAKTNIEAATVETGSFPAAGQESALGIPTMPLGTVALANTGTDSGTITFTFDAPGNDASALVAGKTVTLTRTTATGAWACASSITATERLLPKTCTGA